MLKSNRLLLFLVVCLCGTTLLGLGAAYSQYRLLNVYYKDLNDVRLNPLGVRYHPWKSELIESDKPVVVFYGDSRAFQWTTPSGLAEFATVYNRGVGSETSVQSKERFAYHVPQLQPDVIVLQIGINDLKTLPLFPDAQDVIIQNTKNNIDTLIEKAQAEGAHVVLTTIFPVAEVPLSRRLVWSKDIETAIADVNAHIAAKQSMDTVSVLETVQILTNGSSKVDPSYSVDLLHLNAAGYAALNTELMPLLEALLSGG